MITGVLFLTLASATALPPYAAEARFEDFPVRPEVVPSPHPPVIVTKQARLFRTQLRRAADQGPNFAGHLRVATWGCGTCCQSFGIVNLSTGAVWMPPFFMSCGYPMEDPIRGQAGLYFRPDSALFVAIGSQNEGPVSGIYYYRWNGRALELLKTGAEVPNAAAQQ
jgi:hypothetical protein